MFAPVSGRSIWKEDELTGSLEGKIAIVTGAGQGGGFGSAIAMAREGAAVILIGRTVGNLESVAAVIKETSGSALMHVGDVTKAEDIHAVVDAAIQHFDRLDIFMNGAEAPVARGHKLLDTTDEQVAELWRSGATATLTLMRACIRT